LLPIFLAFITTVTWLSARRLYLTVTRISPGNPAEFPKKGELAIFTIFYWKIKIKKILTWSKSLS
jgi:hypothetical protein